MRYWINFLHFFQPPNQIDIVIKTVARENYQKVINILKKNPKAKIVLNINACLTERLHWYGFDKLLKDITQLAEKGQIEFVESAKFHPILPLIPEKEIRRQIELNHKTNKKYFGRVYKPKGFFPPEMFYTKKLASIVEDIGYKWLILDEISYKGKLNGLKFNKIFKIKNTKNLKVIFRHRGLSRYFSFYKAIYKSDFLKAVKEKLEPGEYLVTAVDGEMFGHRYKNRERFLGNILRAPELKTITISELLRQYKNNIEEIRTFPGCWITLEGEKISRLWNNPNNEIQILKWRLTNLVIKTINKANERDYGYEEARKILDTFLYSCHYWWASCWPWWSLEEIEKGSRGLLMAIKALKDKKYQKAQKQAEKLYNKTMQIAIDWHLSGEAQRRIDEFDRDFKDNWLDV